MIMKMQEKKVISKKNLRPKCDYLEEKSASSANKFEYFGAILTSDEVRVAMKCGWT